MALPALYHISVSVINRPALFFSNYAPPLPPFRPRYAENLPQAGFRPFGAAPVRTPWPPPKTKQSPAWETVFMARPAGFAPACGLSRLCAENLPQAGFRPFGAAPVRTPWPPPKTKQPPA